MQSGLPDSGRQPSRSPQFRTIREHIGMRHDNLSTESVIIKGVDVSAYTIPTDFPEADGTLSWDKTTIVVVRVHAGNKTGLGYSYAHAAAAHLVHDLLAGIVKGKNANDIPAIWREMVRSVRNIGRQGIAATAISAVDSALWDLKARLLELPLVGLLGRVRDSVPVYGSGGFTSYSIGQLQKQLSGWVKSGISRVKMKVGTHPEQDAQRVKAARDAIGKKAELFIDANGAFSRRQALHMMDEFSQFNVSWFEEPVSSDDLEGLRWLRDRAPAGMEIAAGEYGYDPWYFERMLDAGAVDVLQADATRCLGITGLMQVGALCEARQLPLSTHTAPALHLHAGCALRRMRHLEYFHDHVRIENMLFDGVATPKDGILFPDRSRPGLGLELKQADARRFAA